MKTLICWMVASIGIASAVSAKAEVKWTYAQSSATKGVLTEILPEGATYKAWVFNLNPSTGVLSVSTTGEGAVLDLRRETMPAEVPDFTGTLNRLYSYDAGITTCEEVYLPEGITGIGASFVRNWKGLTKIVLPAGLTSIGNTAFYGCSALTSIELPATVTSIGTEAFRSCSALAHIEPGFGGLTSIGYGLCRDCSALADEIWIGYATNNGEVAETVFTGGSGYYFASDSNVKSIHLGPGVSTVPNNFLILTTLKNIEFGCNISTLPAFNNSIGPGITNMVVRHTGDIVLGSYNLNQLTGLRELTWSGWFTVAPGVNNPFNAWTALQCRFIVPGDNAQWRLFVKDAARCLPWASCSSSDKSTYFTRYGSDAREPAGISVAVSGGMPRTYIVLTDAEADSFSLTASASSSDYGEVSVNPAPDANGCYARGTVVTVSFTPRNGGEFVKWTGDVAEGFEGDSVIQVTMDDFKTLTAEVETPGYTYDATAKTISDGATTIKVTANGSALTLGEVTQHRDDGRLDLSKPISGGCMITTISAATTTKIANWVTAVRLPETITTLAAGAFKGCSQLVSIEPFLPNGVTFVGSGALRECPNLTGELWIGYATNALGESVGTSLEDYILRSSPNVKIVHFGPGVTSVPTYTFQFYVPSFVEFGRGITSMGTAFDGNVSKELTNAVFRCTGDLELSNWAFNKQTNLREITWYGWFTAKPGDSNWFNMWTDYQCRFIIPRTNDSWNAFIANGVKLWKDCSDAEKAAYFTRYGEEAVWPVGISTNDMGIGLTKTYLVKTLEGAHETQLFVRTTNEDMSTITVDPPPSEVTGLYADDTVVTVSIALKEGATFDGWTGDVPTGEERSTTFQITMDRSRSLLAKVKVQPAIAEDSFAVTFPKGDSQPHIVFGLTGEPGAVYDATAEILWQTNGTDWVVGQTLTGLVNGQAVASWLPQVFLNGSGLRIKVRVSAVDADDVTAVSDLMTVTGDPPACWGRGGGAGICHVLAGATGDGSGRDWFNAKPTVPASNGDLSDGVQEVWLATNIAYATSPALAPTVSIAFRGGFVGTENAASERPAGLKTVLDGEDSYETFTLSVGTSGTSYRFERIVFTRSSRSGLAVTASSNAPVFEIADCDFVANGANGTVTGRGLHLQRGGVAVISNCTFRGNVCRSCPNNSSGEGFGAYFEGNDRRVYLDSCLFLTNGYAGVGHTTAFSAAFGANTKVVTARNCEFRGNRSSVYSHGSIVGLSYLSQNGGSAFTNCVFVGNELCGRGRNGGAEAGSRAGIVEMNLANAGQKNQTADFCNCTFAYNVGGNLSDGSCGLTAVIGTIHAVNCIFFDNVSNSTGADLSASTANGTILAEYCLFGGTDGKFVKNPAGGVLTTGEGIVTGNPRFLTPRSVFLGLTTNVGSDNLPQSGNVDPKFTEPFDPKLLALDVHVRSTHRSPVIDAGDPLADWTNEPEPNGGRINLGAYGNTPWATMTPLKGDVLRVR